MRLGQLPSLLLDDLTRTLRRRLIVGAVVTACAVAAAIEGVAAARLALEPIMGPVGSRLVLVGAFVLMAGVAVVVLTLVERRSARARGSDADTSARTAIIAEAISVGYSLGQDFMRASPHGGAQPNGDGREHTTDADGDPRRPSA